MKDRCKAAADTLAEIPEAGYAFTPPAGWEYAMLEEATVTQMSEAGPVLVLASMVTDKAAYKASAQRTAKVASLAELVGIEPPSKVSFTRSNKRKLSGLEMTLWENEATRGGEKGALLILSAPAGERDVFGIGWAAAGDIEGTKTILATLETFKAVESSGTSDESGGDEGGGDK